MDRKKLEKLAWQKTHKDFKSKWNNGDATVCRFVPGSGTCLVHITKLTDNELREIARLPKEEK